MALGGRLRQVTGATALGISLLAFEDSGMGSGNFGPVFLLVVLFLVFVLGFGIRDLLARHKQRAARKQAMARARGGP